MKTYKTHFKAIPDEMKAHRHPSVVLAKHHKDTKACTENCIRYVKSMVVSKVSWYEAKIDTFLQFSGNDYNTTDATITALFNANFEAYEDNYILRPTYTKNEYIVNQTIADFAQILRQRCGCKIDEVGEFIILSGRMF